MEWWELGADVLEYYVKTAVKEKSAPVNSFLNSGTVTGGGRSRKSIGGAAGDANSEVGPEAESEDAKFKAATAAAIAAETAAAARADLLQRLGPLPPINPFRTFYLVAGLTNEQLLEAARKFKTQRIADDAAAKIASERFRKRRRTYNDNDSDSDSGAGILNRRIGGTKRRRDGGASDSDDDGGRSRGNHMVVVGAAYKEFEVEWEANDPAEIKALRERKKYLVAGLYSAVYKSADAPSPTSAAAAAATAAASGIIVIPPPAAPLNAVVVTRKTNVDGFEFPMPIYFGEYLMNHEKDFEVPYDIACCVEAMGNKVKMYRKPMSKRDPTPYQKLQKNLFVDRKPRKPIEVTVCKCEVPEDGSPACGDNCLNRCMFIECNPITCPCGEACTNQIFQRRVTDKVVSVYWTGYRGHGLKAIVDIPKNKLVMEYKGEILSAKSLSERMANEYRDLDNYYILSYGDGEVIDAGRKGNEARFVNHSCEPNCRIEKWSVNGEYCVGLFAEEDIPLGAELTYDYRFESFGPMQECLCGASKCRGFLGNNKKKEKEEEEIRDPKRIKIDKKQAKARSVRASNQARDRSFWLRKHARDKLVYQVRDVMRHKRYVLGTRVFLVRNLIQKVLVENLGELAGIVPPAITGPDASGVDGNGNPVNPAAAGVGGGVGGAPCIVTRKRFAGANEEVDSQEKKPASQASYHAIQAGIELEARAHRRKRNLKAIIADLNEANKGKA